MYIRKMSREWKTKAGETKKHTYFYWYKSKRIGEEIISQCMGKASEEEYKDLLVKKPIVKNKFFTITSQKCFVNAL